MGFIGAPKVGTDPLRQVASRKHVIQFHHLALGMDPFGFNRVEPGTFGGQQERQDPYAFARLLDLLIAGADPGPHGLTRVPGGVIPDQEPMRLALLEQAFAAPLQELSRDGADWPSSDEPQPDLRAVGVIRSALLPKHAVARQRLGIGVVLAPGLLDQPHWLILTLP